MQNEIVKPEPRKLCNLSRLMNDERPKREIYYRRRRKGHHRMAARRGEARRKKRLGAFFAFDEALESLVSIPSTHTH